MSTLVGPKVVAIGQSRQKACVLLAQARAAIDAEDMAGARALVVAAERLLEQGAAVGPTEVTQLG